MIRGSCTKRDAQGPEGHEERSSEYSKLLLKRHGFDTKNTEQILRCITATKHGVPEPNNVNEKIVRSADVLSQFLSCHYLAKAAFFTGDFGEYLDWLEERVENCKKISFEDERKETEHAYQYLKQAVHSYRAQKY